MFGSHEKTCGLCVDFCQSEQEKLSIYDATQQSPELGAPDKPCGVGRADANPKLLLNDT